MSLQYPPPLPSPPLSSLSLSLSPPQDANIGHPTVPETNIFSRSVKIFPAECRERAATYKAKMSITLRWKVDGLPAGSLDKVVGHIPIMVKVWLV